MSDFDVSKDRPETTKFLYDLDNSTNFQVLGVNYWEQLRAVLNYKPICECNQINPITDSVDIVALPDNTDGMPDNADDVSDNNPVVVIPPVVNPVYDSDNPFMNLLKPINPSFVYLLNINFSDIADFYYTMEILMGNKTNPVPEFVVGKVSVLEFNALVSKYFHAFTLHTDPVLGFYLYADELNKELLMDRLNLFAIDYFNLIKASDVVESSFSHLPFADELKLGSVSEYLDGIFIDIFARRNDWTPDKFKVVCRLKIGISKLEFAYMSFASRKRYTDFMVYFN